MNKRQKGFTPIIIALVILLLAGAGGTSYYLVNKDSQKQTPIDETANWNLYENKEYGFEIKYPSIDWDVKHSSNGFSFFEKINEEKIDYCFEMGCLSPEISIVFTPYQNIEHLWLWEIIQQKPEKKPALVSNNDKIEKKEISIGNQKVIKIEGSDDKLPNWKKSYYIIDSPAIKSLIIFSPTEDKQENSTSYNSIVEKMISTFKFTSTERTVHAGIIGKAYQKDGKEYIDVNFIKFIGDGYIYGENDEEGNCDPKSMPDPYCVIDNDKTIKSFTIATDVVVVPAMYPGKAISYLCKDYISNKIEGYAYINDSCENGSARTIDGIQSPYKMITIENNTIIMIKEIYTP
jgi:hypothetical protein